LLQKLFLEAVKSHASAANPIFKYRCGEMSYFGSSCSRAGDRIVGWIKSYSNSGLFSSGKDPSASLAISNR